jgi:pyruvate carboxylase subunit B
MEAMKMENELRAPSDGTVSAILATPSNPVNKGAVLVQLS